MKPLAARRILEECGVSPPSSTTSTSITQSTLTSSGKAGWSLKSTTRPLATSGTHSLTSRVRFPNSFSKVCSEKGQGNLTRLDLNLMFFFSNEAELICPDGLSQGWDFQLPSGWQVEHLHFYWNNMFAAHRLPQILKSLSTFRRTLISQFPASDQTIDQQH